MKKTILFFVFLICIASAVAEPPFQATEVSEGYLEIIHPQLEYYRHNEDINFNFMVVNSSGALLNASAGDVDCNIRIQNSSNDIISMGAANKNDFYFNPTIETGYQGIFSYQINCNASNSEYGFESYHYYVTHTGIEETEEDRTLIAIIAVIPLILAIFLLVGAATLGQEHALIRIFLFLLSPAFFYTSLHYAILGVIKFYNFPELQDAASTTIFWTGIVWGIIIVYFLIYAIYKMVKKAAQDKEEEMEY